MGGIGLQLFFILCFIGLAIRFQGQMRRDAPGTDQKRALRMLYILYAALTFIAVSVTLLIIILKKQTLTKIASHQIRIIFRLIEYSHGYKSGIPVHEAYQYIFDSTLMFIALVLLNIVHPGQVMPGKDSDLPNRTERKIIGKKNVKGRMGGELPLFNMINSTLVTEAGSRPESNAMYPKADEKPGSIEYVRKLET